jgi:molybdopterin synthase catalytic subunit
MDAAQIIEEIRLLPEDEMGRVVEFVEELRSAKSGKTARHIDAETFEATAEKVFRDHAPLFEKLAR